jgi:CHAP domain
MRAESILLGRISRVAVMVTAAAALAGLTTVSPAAGSVLAGHVTTGCSGPGDFGTEYLSAAWPGGFTGVPVYSNGTAGYTSNCDNSATTPAGKSVESGMEWQCVELINRLYITKGWIDKRWTGDGDKLYYDPPVDPATGQHLTTQPQHSITALSPGDVISFKNPAVDGGHAAVVSAVSGTSITLVNQNTSKSNVLSYAHLTDGTLTMTGWKGYTPIGVIDAPKAAPWGKAIEVPGIAALNTGGDAAVISVSCPSSGNCTAGGQYGYGKGQDAAFVVSEVNGTWGTAHKVSGTADGGAITSLSCASAGNCSAGGQDYPWAFVVSEVNGTWGKAIVVPGASAKGIVQSSVSSVSCGSPGNCSAGGFYSNGVVSEAFVVSQSGGRWGHLQEVPGTAALNTGGYAQVTSVSCGSAGNCSAGGQYQDADGNQVFVVSQSGGTWGKAIEVPGIARLTSKNAELNSVSCAVAGNCSAVGDTDQDAFVASQIRGTWHTAIKVHGIPSGDLTSVSCGSPGTCETGGYYGASDGTQAFVASETDGTWGTATNLPGTSGTGDEVTTISCGPAGNCAAGGNSTGDHAFVASETGGTWGTATPVSGLGTGGSDLWSVSCPAVGNCAAGGSYVNSSGKTEPFVVAQS